ncbi:MAG: hypothetical protein HRT55_01880 [Colwellia sp.]|nr:hypothetical protein [Colwellia sp.]NQZ25048.1 hypothetical protein [Colwellia sp.]
MKHSRKLPAKSIYFCHIVNKWRALGGWPLAEAESESEAEAQEKIPS